MLRRCPRSTVSHAALSQPLPATLQATARVSGVSFSRYVPSIPFFRLAVGGLGPSHTEKTNWPKGAPGMVNLSLPLMASVVPVARDISEDHLLAHFDILECTEKTINVGLHRRRGIRSIIFE